MKQTPFVSLVFDLFQGIKRALGIQPADDPSVVGILQRLEDRNRPLEQIINEGSLGIIEKDEVDNFRNCWRPEKTRAEKDYEFLKSRYKSKSDLMVLSHDRFEQVHALSFENEEVEKWFDKVYSETHIPFIFLPGCVNIGIVHS
jgi:hypothetical protein